MMDDTVDSPLLSQAKPRARSCGGLLVVSLTLERSMNDMTLFPISVHACCNCILLICVLSFLISQDLAEYCSDLSRAEC